MFGVSKYTCARKAFPDSVVGFFGSKAIFQGLEGFIFSDPTTLAST